MLFYLYMNLFHKLNPFSITQLKNRFRKILMKKDRLQAKLQVVFVCKSTKIRRNHHNALRKKKTIIECKIFYFLHFIRRAFVKKLLTLLCVFGVCGSALAKTDIYSFRAMTKAESRQNEMYGEEGYDWFVFPTNKGSVELYWANPAFDVFSKAYTSKPQKCVQATNLDQKGKPTAKTKFTIVKCPKK
jgi:hypothetical protein